MQQQTLFGLPDYIAKPRTHDGKFTPKCDGEPQQKIKECLLLGMSLTVKDCLKLTHSTEMRRIISRLRKSGMNIGDKWCHDSYGHKYKSYFLVKEVKDANKNTEKEN